MDTVSIMTQVHDWYHWLVSIMNLVDIQPWNWNQWTVVIKSAISNIMTEFQELTVLKQ